jgi:preprotein translocase subunit SecG
MIGIVFFKSFKDKPFGAFIFKYAFISIPILFIAFIFISILLGYFESKLGLKEEEQKKLTASNPVMMELCNDIKEIKNELAKQKSNK